MRRLRTAHKRATRRRRLERRKLIARAHITRIVGILPKLVEKGYRYAPESRFLREVNAAIKASLSINTGGLYESRRLEQGLRLIGHGAGGGHRRPNLD